MRTDLELLKNALDIKSHTFGTATRALMVLTMQFLLEEGFTEHEIRTLVHDNAAELPYE